MFDLFHLFLYLHIGGAIIAFGPTFAFPILGAAGGREPQHANFMTRANLTVSDRIVAPVALSMAITGAGLIWVAHLDLTKQLWLGVAIVLYVIALVNALGFLRPTVKRIIALTSTPPGPSGPPPELRPTIQRAQRLGALNLVLVLTILFLMVFKPGA